ncbi:hypothetical protein [Paenibacillus sp. NPDC058071]|uniref:hypothetical protein n=1 Tax=Paenibacillus sp. NPDC058071 TaxID=3346326 RepID=UPI0036DE225C
MIVVLLAGREGRGLWPLSNVNLASPFVSLYPNEEGEMLAAVQQLYARLQTATSIRGLYVAVGQSQATEAARQLGREARLIREPALRGSYRAAQLAAAYLHEIAGCSLQETIVAIPADWEYDEEKLATVDKLSGLLLESEAGLPASGEGSGAYAFRLGAMLSRLSDERLPRTYTELCRVYGKVESIELERIVPETHERDTKEPSNDSCSWADVLRRSADTAGREGNLVWNKLGLPITIAGLYNIAVAISASGLLIMNRDLPDLSLVPWTALNNAQVPTGERADWGTAAVLDQTVSEDGEESQTRRLTVEAGCSTGYGLHLRRRKLWTVLSGTGEIIINERLQSVLAGTVLELNARSRHGIKATSKLELLEIHFGSGLEEEDFISLAESWEEINILSEDNKTLQNV